MRVLPLIGETNPYGRRLRRDATVPERLLWQHLRNRQLAGLKFRRHATIGPYVVDFLCVEAKLAIEADGGQHSPETDSDRTAFLTSRGLKVLRSWNNEILANLDGVLEAILLAVKNQKPSPYPLPPAGEG